MGWGMAGAMKVTHAYAARPGGDLRGAALGYACSTQEHTAAVQIPAPRGEGGKGSAAESATAGTFDYAALRHSSAPNARVAKRLRRGPYLRGGPVAPRTAKHAPHMTAGEPDHVIFPISPQREKQQCKLPIISPAVAATSCGVGGGGGVALHATLARTQRASGQTPAQRPLSERGSCRTENSKARSPHDRW